MIAADYDVRKRSQNHVKISFFYDYDHDARSALRVY